jgi:release factor glutamine methyltransferase
MVEAGLHTQGAERMLDLTEGPPTPSPWDALRPIPFPRIGRLAAKALRLAYALTGRDRIGDLRVERVLGIPLLVMPSVFNPKMTRTGAFLAAHLDSRFVSADADVLDMGTGSGVCAIFAARRARSVVAVDINPAAARCTAINARLNHLEDRIEVRHGDLFAPVAGERFNLILFNPPFLRGAPRDDCDRAWRSTDVAERFAAGLGDHLKPFASALVVLSTFGDAQGFLGEFRRHGLTVTVLAERRYFNERLAIFRLQPPSVRSHA